MSDEMASTDPQSRPVAPEPAAPVEPLTVPISAEPVAFTTEPPMVPAQSAPPAEELTPTPPATAAAAGEPVRSEPSATRAEQSAPVGEPSVPVAQPSEPSVPVAQPSVPAAPAPLKTRATAIIAATRANPRRKAFAGVGVGVIALLVLGAVGYAVWDRFYADPTRNAVPGHCIGGLPLVDSGEDREVSTARLVSCDDAAAVYLVEGRLDNVTDEQSRDRDICRGYRHATDIYRAVPPGGTGYVLCLSRRPAG